MKNKISLAAVLVGLFLMVGIGGGMDQGTISTGKAVICMVIVITGMITAIKIGRLTEECE